MMSFTFIHRLAVHSSVRHPLI